MKENSKISVIIPVYNTQKFLRRCLDSVIHNSVKDLEIICIDDGSTDNSLEILHNYEEKDSRFIVISKANGGLASARNAGLKICTGKWVAFIDSDDWIHENYFSILLSVHKGKDYDVVVGGHVRTKDNDCLNYEIKDYNVKELNRASYLASSKTKGYVWGRLYKRESIEGLIFDEKEKMAHCKMNLQ